MRQTKGLVQIRLQRRTFMHGHMKTPIYMEDLSFITKIIIIILMLKLFNVFFFFSFNYEPHERNLALKIPWQMWQERQLMVLNIRLLILEMISRPCPLALISVFECAEVCLIVGEHLSF